jgi:hypothetical protein
MTNTTVKIGWAIVAGVAVFVVSAVAEGFITAFIFRRYGGCPMIKDQKTKQAYGPIMEDVKGAFNDFKEQLIKENTYGTDESDMAKGT